MQTFFNQELTIERNARIDATNKYTYQALNEVVYPCNVQSPTDEESNLFAGKYGQIKACFVELVCPAEIADRLIIDTKKYKVKSVKESTWGSVEFKKLLIVEEDASN